jgi:hypothetical protein
MTLGYVWIKRTSGAFSFASAGPALAIEAIAGYSLNAVVTTDTVREETRRSLIEKLRVFTAPERVVTTSRGEEVEEVVLVSTDATATPRQPLLCRDGSISGSGVRTWGTVNVTRAEGARIISSVALADDGTSLQRLELTDAPVPQKTPSCLPTGMVGIALDGRVIEAGSPFQTNAEGIAGYALDGFAVYGTAENGVMLTSETLDACHGHIHPIVWDGAPTSMYHYHVTEDAPYAVGCFRGTPRLLE